MTTQQKILANVNGVYSVGVVFQDPERYPGQQVYTYLTRELHDIGSLVLVRARNEWKVVQVVEFYSKPQLDPRVNFDYQWIVQKIDVSAWRREMREEQAAIMDYEASEASDMNL